MSYTVEGDGFAQIAPYDMILRNFEQASYLFSPQFGRDAVFIRLETSEASFDTAVFCRLNSDGTPSAERNREFLRQLQFRALLRSKDEEREIAKVILRDCTPSFWRLCVNSEDTTPIASSGPA